MSPHVTLFLFTLLLLASGCSLARFSRSDARCIAFCGGRDSEECRGCGGRIPMRFGKRKADVRLLAIRIPGRTDDSNEEDSYAEDDK